MTRFNKFAFLAMFVVVTQHTSSAFKNGDTCGVTSSDFMNYDYRSDYLVAGKDGCSLGEEESGCFCAPNLRDGERLGEWEWQCDNVVEFGPNPATSKTCPEKVPVPKGLGLLDVVLQRRNLQTTTTTQEEGGQDDGTAKNNDNNNDDNNNNNVVSVGSESQQQQMQGVPCDTSLNPTGQPGDEMCPYSDCDDGGEHSAICACIDMKKYGMGDGMEWVCMHATCNCGENEREQKQDEGIPVLVPDDEGSIGEVSNVVASGGASTSSATFAFILPISIISVVAVFK